MFKLCITYLVTGQFRPLDNSNHPTQTLPTQTPPNSDHPNSDHPNSDPSRIRPPPLILTLNFSHWGN